MNEVYVLSMNFNTDAGKVFNIRLTHADPDVLDIDVKSAMETVVSSDVIAHKNGSPVSAHSARLIKTEAVDIDVK